MSQCPLPWCPGTRRLAPLTTYSRGKATPPQACLRLPMTARAPDVTATVPITPVCLPGLSGAPPLCTQGEELPLPAWHVDCPTVGAVSSAGRGAALPSPQLLARPPVHQRDPAGPTGLASAPARGPGDWYFKDTLTWLPPRLYQASPAEDRAPLQAGPPHPGWRGPAVSARAPARVQRLQREAPPRTESEAGLAHIPARLPTFPAGHAHAAGWGGNCGNGHTRDCVFN